MNKKIHNNLSIENLMKTDWINQFDEDQQVQIRIGIKSNLDVSMYANPEYSWRQMEEIRKGLKQSLDISWYANPSISAREMELIRWGLEDDLDVSLYVNRGYSFKHMREIRDRLHMLKEDAY